MEYHDGKAGVTEGVLGVTAVGEDAGYDGVRVAEVAGDRDTVPDMESVDSGADSFDDSSDLVP